MVGFLVSCSEDKSSDPLKEDTQTKSIALEIINTITDGFSDHNSNVRLMAVSVMEKLVEHGGFNRQLVERAGHLNL
jgi:hypothetical protein